MSQFGLNVNIQLPSSFGPSGFKHLELVLKKKDSTKEDIVVVKDDGINNYLRGVTDTLISKPDNNTVWDNDGVLNNLEGTIVNLSIPFQNFDRTSSRLDIDNDTYVLGYRIENQANLFSDWTIETVQLGCEHVSDNIVNPDNATACFGAIQTTGEPWYDNYHATSGRTPYPNDDTVCPQYAPIDAWELSGQPFGDTLTNPVETTVKWPTNGVSDVPCLVKNKYDDTVYKGNLHRSGQYGLLRCKYIKHTVGETNFDKESVTANMNTPSAFPQQAGSAPPYGDMSYSGSTTAWNDKEYIVAILPKAECATDEFSGMSVAYASSWKHRLRTRVNVPSGFPEDMCAIIEGDTSDNYRVNGIPDGTDITFGTYNGNWTNDLSNPNYRCFANKDGINLLKGKGGTGQNPAVLHLSTALPGPDRTHRAYDYSSNTTDDVNDMSSYSSGKKNNLWLGRYFSRG